MPSSESPRLGLFSALEQKWLDTEMYQKTQYTDQLTFSPDYTATFTANVWIIIIPESITWFYNSLLSSSKPEFFHSAGKIIIMSLLLVHN